MDSFCVKGAQLMDLISFTASFMGQILDERPLTRGERFITATELELQSFQAKDPKKPSL